MFAVLAFARFEILAGFLFLSLQRFGGLNIGGNLFVLECLGHLCDECFIPGAHTLHGLVEAGTVAADHGTGDGIGQCEHPAGDGTERCEVAVESHDFVHMLVEHGINQLHGPRFAQRLRILVEADEQTVLAHDGLEECVVCGDFRLEERGAGRSSPATLIAHHGRRHAGQQFGGGLAREGETQDPFRRDALFDQVDDAPGHGVGFAGSRACDHHHIGV